MFLGIADTALFVYFDPQGLGGALQDRQASRSILTCFGSQPMSPAILLSRNQN